MAEAWGGSFSDSFGDSFNIVDAIPDVVSTGGGGGGTSALGWGSIEKYRPKPKRARKVIREAERVIAAVPFDLALLLDDPLEQLKTSLGRLRQASVAAEITAQGELVAHLTAIVARMVDEEETLMMLLAA